MKKTVKVFAVIFVALFAVIILAAAVILFMFITNGTVINGKFCDVYELTHKENDTYIVFPDFLYNKENEKFTRIHNKDGKYYYIGYYDDPEIELYDDYFTIRDNNSRTIYCNYDGLVYDETKEKVTENKTEKTLFDTGFYSSYQRENTDKIELTEEEQIIWNYCKSKAVTTEYPYMIEGNFKVDEKYIYFNVNVYNKMMWKGSGLVNQGVVSATLNRYDRNTKEITELYDLEKCAIKAFEADNYFYYYKKDDNSLHFLDLVLGKDKAIDRVNNYNNYFVDEEYCIVENALERYRMIKVR